MMSSMKILSVLSTVDISTERAITCMCRYRTICFSLSLGIFWRYYQLHGDFGRADSRESEEKNSVWCSSIYRVIEINTQSVSLVLLVEI